MGTVLQFKSREAGRAERVAGAIVAFVMTHHPDVDEAVLVTALAAAFVEGAKVLGVDRKTALHAVRTLWEGD